MDPMTPGELSRRCLHHEKGLLVLDKPHDLPSSGRHLEDPDCLQTQLILREGRMVWAVHQLDADTSGLNLFVTEKQLVQHYKRRLSWPNCEKSYLAILQGNPCWKHKHVQAPTGPVPDSNPTSLGVTPTGRASSTHFEVLTQGTGAHLARVRIETGRTHQIRIHAAHIGHPLIGEEWYKKPPCEQHPRQALHAHRLRFRDEQFPAAFEAALPQDLVQLCARLQVDLSCLGEERP